MNDKKAESHETVEEFKFDDLPPIKGFPELRWAGKRPFRSTHYFPAQKKESYGEPVDGWMNRIYWGDNLQVMSHLLKEFRGKVDLIYIDPPFDSKADYKKIIKTRGISAKGDMSSFEEKQYTDIWNNDDYLTYLYERLVLMRELLAQNGSIYIHCDYRKSAYIRLIADEIFGPGRFINEIIWLRTNAHNMKSKGYVRSNDQLLLYTRSSDYKFNEQFQPYSEAQLSRYKEDEDGRLFTGQDLTFSSESDSRRFEWRGSTPPPGRAWGASKDQLEEWWETGLILKKRDGAPRLDGYKKYLDDGKGTPLNTNWSDVSRVGNTSSERLGYPTQKPETLLERIVKVSSNQGDLILDGFMGSGTTQAVSMKLGRRFLGADINLGAVETTVKRLNLIRHGADQDDLKLDDEHKLYSGFEVYNVNNYDIFRNPVQAKEVLKEALELQPLERNAVFDGIKDGFMVKIMPVNRIATRQDLNELITGIDYKSFERRRSENPNNPVERIELVCMGHEPDLAATLQEQMKPYDVEVRVVDVLRDKTHLEFKRSAEAKVVIEDGKLIVENFFPMNLLQKLSVEEVDDWRQLVESIKIDWNYDGAVLEPAIIESPEGNDLVSGSYDVPDEAGTIRIKITDLLSESLELNVESNE